MLYNNLDWLGIWETFLVRHYDQSTFIFFFDLRIRIHVLHILMHVVPIKRRRSYTMEIVEFNQFYFGCVHMDSLSIHGSKPYIFNVIIVINLSYCFLLWHSQTKKPTKIISTTEPGNHTFVLRIEGKQRMHQPSAKFRDRISLFALFF